MAYVTLRRYSLVLLLAIAVASSYALAQSPYRLYTTDADFDQGTAINLNHNAPNNNQLQLNQQSTPFPFVNIAASGRGTAIRIDVNTGGVLGEYRTSPNGMGSDPSRTTVDKYGNVWVANRGEYGLVNGVSKGSVARFGLFIGGTRSDASGNPNPAGQYVKPPFAYNTCVDRDGDGLIKTSRGLGDILPWTNAAGADSFGGVTTAEDECILNYTRVNGTGTRTLAVDANNDVWVGGIGNAAHEKLNGQTGQPVPGTAFNAGCGGYGGLMDATGQLWSTRSLMRFVPNATPPPAGQAFCLAGDLAYSPYGIARDPNTGHIWLSSLGGLNLVYELDTSGNVLNSYPQPFFGAQGIAVDSNSHVWVAQLFGSVVWHLAPDAANPGKHLSVGLVQGLLGVTGVAVDANGKIWAAEISGSRTSRIDPLAGPMGGGGMPIGAIDLSVSLGPGASPYNYSDMTGFVAVGSPAPSGTWVVVHDSQKAATKWGRALWNANTPAGTSIKVELRAADQLTSLPATPFLEVDNNGSVCSSNVAGRYVEMRVMLARSAQAAVSPILYDIAVQACDSTPPVITGMPTACSLWPPNHKMVKVADLKATDTETGVASFTITATSNEPENGLGDGDQYPDIMIDGGAVYLRAERSGLQPGRIYTILAKAVDGAGNEAVSTSTCVVSHDQGK